MIGTGDIGGQERGRATRRQIVEVGRRLFSAYGYHATSLADIQAATGLTKGAFYHHFDSKEALCLSVLEAAAEDYEREWLASARSEDSAEGRLVAMLDAAVRLNARPEWCNCALMAVMAGELTDADGAILPAVRAWWVGWLEAWREAIADAQEAGLVGVSIKPSVAAEWVAGSLLGAVLTRKLGVSVAELDAVVGLVKHTLVASSSRRHGRTAVAEHG